MCHIRVASLMHLHMRKQRGREKMINMPMSHELWTTFFPVFPLKAFSVFSLKCRKRDKKIRKVRRKNENKSKQTTPKTFFFFGSTLSLCRFRLFSLSSSPVDVGDSINLPGEEMSFVVLESYTPEQWEERKKSLLFTFDSWLTTRNVSVKWAARKERVKLTDRNWLIKNGGRKRWWRHKSSLKKYTEEIEGRGSEKTTEKKKVEKSLDISRLLGPLKKSSLTWERKAWAHPSLSSRRALHNLV